MYTSILDILLFYFPAMFFCLYSIYLYSKLGQALDDIEIKLYMIEKALNEKFTEKIQTCVF